MFNIFKFKEKRFMREAFSFFYMFGEKAGLEEDRITGLLPRTSRSVFAVKKSYAQRLKPIDAAMILADCCVAEAEEKINFVKSGQMSKNIQLRSGQGNDLLSALSSPDMLAAWAEGDKKAAEKIQMAAFEMGPALGSMIALQEGKFKEIAEKFSRPVE